MAILVKTKRLSNALLSPATFPVVLTCSIRDTNILRAARERCDRLVVGATSSGRRGADPQKWAVRPLFRVEGALRPRVVAAASWMRWSWT